VLETCESSLSLIRAFKQDENKFPKLKLPVEEGIPPLKSAKGKKLVSKKKTDKPKTNSISAVTRTLNVKSKTKKTIMKKKKITRPAAAAATKESETPKEEADEVKLEPKEEEGMLCLSLSNTATD